MNENRREFLKKGLVGACGAALVPKAWAGIDQGVKEAGGVPALPFRALGRTGIQTPLISMGTGETSSADLIRRGYDAGIKLFFSATYYGQGNNERLVGEALKGLPRDSFVVGTAATPEGLNPREGIIPKSLTAHTYMKTAEDSLKRFGLDHVDILLMPFAGKREAVRSEPILQAMTELKKQGKIRFAGIATHNMCEEALKAAADAKVYDVAMTAYNYKVADKAALREAVAYATKAGMGVVAMKTTAGGGPRDKTGARPLEVRTALKWVLQDENVSSIVSGMSSVEELRKNLEMLKDPKMSDEELKAVEVASLGPEPGLYCRQCRVCLPQCPHGLDIPTLMRSYMYAYGYRQMGLARGSLDTVDLSGRPCERCETCGVSCASGFDIRGRVLDIARLKDVPPEFIRA